mmetsp:Transcript_31390/g.73240  ORF Transcript_31390/g.73240 Transcript_31390/m.73240 type:complete len:217 (-) Transcript_31390:14-664(-)
MPTPETKPGQPGDPLAGLSHLEAALKDLAPKLAPSFFHIDDAEATLERLYPGQQAGERLEEIKRQLAASREGLVFHLEWQLDMTSRRKQLKQVLLLEPSLAKIRTLPVLIKTLACSELLSAPGDAATELVKLFLESNGHDLADVHLLQDAVSVAYSLYVVLKEIELMEVSAFSLEELLGKSFPQCKAPMSGKKKAAVEQPRADQPTPPAKRQKSRR